MTRYGAAHKQATRERIVSTAARRLKSDGVAGSGVATLMADAGLTNGAFYAHFASKEALVATVVEAELATQCRTLADLAPGRAGVEDLVRRYLSPTHRDHPEAGCPSAALVEDVVRAGAEVREAYTSQVVAVGEVLAGLVGDAGPDARARLLAAFAGMVGTLQLARAVTDRRLSDALLAHGAEQALAAFAGPAVGAPTSDGTRPGPTGDDLPGSRP
ncbi:DNA-binding transcriptional regulator, AcrR family [Microlunatus sagamiharensis]|uniref:DNA-binding transcriptional regulator, AcrR family n=1 Tax=Microlunatus sagamiharensis TaxID=546874 RepID=A0A1H2LMC5_9ACTN|nr:TetR/AcrR family transcriptional regulator [Microlunatus sagamiharensis]SDU81982.1 DNA-binding transcriptional regulator, AcrR family [Microlunatus sagamiharensis]